MWTGPGPPPQEDRTSMPLLNTFRPGRRLVILALFITIGGAIGVLIGPDANWDLRNYHLYNPHALLTDRTTLDIAPAQRQSYHNPYADLPFYFLVSTLNDQPRLIAFLMSVPYGLAGAVLLWLTHRLLGPMPRPGPERTQALIERGAAMAIGMTGAATVSVIGSTMNEIQITVFILLALALGVRRLITETLSPNTLLLLGLCVGVAGGLKMSYAVHGLGIGVALFTLVILGRLRIREFLASGAGVLIGLGVTAGPWMWHLYEVFGNPLFPYYNDIFHSPFAEQARFNDPRFFPSSLGEGLTYPFRWVFSDSAIAAEMPFRDIRFAAVIVLGGLAALTLMPGFGRLDRHSGPRATPPRDGRRDSLLFLGLYMAVAFGVWLAAFGIYRYAVPLEFLSGPIIVIMARHIVRFRPAVYLPVLVALATLIIATTDPLRWGRGQYGERFIAVDLPAVPENASVFLLGGAPMGYIAAFMPAGVPVIGLENNFLTSSQENRSLARIGAILQNPAGPLLAVVQSDHAPQSPLLERFGYGIALTQCRAIASNIDGGLRLCPLEKRG